MTCGVGAKLTRRHARTQHAIGFVKSRGESWTEVKWVITTLLEGQPCKKRLPQRSGSSAGAIGRVWFERGVKGRASSDWWKRPESRVGCIANMALRRRVGVPWLVVAPGAHDGARVSTYRRYEVVGGREASRTAALGRALALVHCANAHQWTPMLRDSCWYRQVWC